MSKTVLWLIIVCSMVAVMIMAACAPPITEREETALPAREPEAPAESAPPKPAAPSADSEPPALITGLAAANAYDGKLNLRWDESQASDFARYEIYASETEISDTAGLTPVHQISDSATSHYQVTGLKDGTGYYLAVVAVDHSNNRNRRVASVRATPTAMPRGSADPEIIVDINNPEETWAGTTLLADNHQPERPRVIEVNMLGEIIWEYPVPQNLRQYTNPGFDVEWLPNDNILLVLPGYGVFEVNRRGDTVWSYRDSQVSHDADRLPNGNTLVVYGNEDSRHNAQVKEISPQGDIVWAWYARDHFDTSPYKDIYDQGWTHTNAVSRLASGNTLISPRNFNFVLEVDPRGSVVRTIGEGILHYQHDPEMLADGNLLVANHRQPHRIVEIEPETGGIVWQSAGFERDISPVRDANRLPNGNTLITGTTRIMEITAAGKIVWQLALKGVTFQRAETPALGFYKAERISRHSAH